MDVYEFIMGPLPFTPFLRPSEFPVWPIALVFAASQNSEAFGQSVTHENINWIEWLHIKPLSGVMPSVDR